MHSSTSSHNSGKNSSPVKFNCPFTPLVTPTVKVHWRKTHKHSAVFLVVQSLSRVQLFATYGLQHARLYCPPLSPRVCSGSCPLAWWCYLTNSLSALPFAFNLSQHRVFPSESVLRIRWPKYWSFSFCINASNEYWVLISFRIDWFDLLAVQRILKNLLQHHTADLIDYLLP